MIIENCEPSKTSMMRAWKIEDNLHRKYKNPVPKVVIEQGENKVILTKRHIEILFEKNSCDDWRLKA